MSYEDIELWNIEKPTPKDIKAMLALNYKIYPEEWHVTEDYVEQVMRKNPEVYNVLRTSDGIKGIFSIFPLSKTNYELVLNGELKEDELVQCILTYDHPKHVCLYLISLIVDIHDPLRKLYAKSILQVIPGELRHLEEQGITIDEIGAIAVTADGNRILPRIGFNLSAQEQFSDETLNVYRATIDRIYDAIVMD